MLQLGYVGGLGLMASPGARHLAAGGAARVLRVHDRGTPGARRDAARRAWREHGAELVPTLEALVGDGDLDGAVVCAGKNGDDLPLLGELAPSLSARGRGEPFVLHLSTVSTGFAEAAAAFCGAYGVGYANTPLTGGPLGAERGGDHPQGMLILAGGDEALYRRVEPVLRRLGRPRHLGSRPAAGAETKLIGQFMVFEGLLGLSTAAALHAECFRGGALGGPEQAEFLEFLDGGAGGTRQWEVALSKGIRDGVWDEGFLLHHAAVDALYAAELAQRRGLPRAAIRGVLTVAFAFAYLLRRHPGETLATHALARVLVAAEAERLDAFVADAGRDDVRAAIAAGVAALPEPVRGSARPEVAVADFEAAARDAGAQR